MQQSSSKDELTPQLEDVTEDASILYIKGTIRHAQQRPKIDLSPVTYRQRSRSNSSSSRPKTTVSSINSVTKKDSTGLPSRGKGAPSTAPGGRRNSLKSTSNGFRKVVRSNISIDSADQIGNDSPWQCLKCFAENEGDMPGCYVCATARGHTGARGDDSKVIMRANIGGFKR